MKRLGSLEPTTKRSEMTTGLFLMTLTLATAVLALWSYVRWPGAAPATMKGAVVRVVISLVLLQVGAAAFGLGIAAAPSLAILLLVGTVVPVLTFAFLASIWFLKACADQIRGAA
jgi:hypothetical protein